MITSRPWREAGVGIPALPPPLTVLGSFVWVCAYSSVCFAPKKSQKFGDGWPPPFLRANSAVRCGQFSAPPCVDLQELRSPFFVRE